MTTKEKAEQLVGRMYLVHSNSASEITMYFARQCALIAVDEVIKYAKRWGDMADDDIREFEEVKQEIEQLFN